MTTAATSALPPGSRLGILGTGQLGRMTALAAARLGYDVAVFGPEADAPAARVCDRSFVAGWDDEAALAEFAAEVGAVTLEFENVPVEVLERLEATVPVRPGPGLLRVTQDRLAEKRFATENGIATVAFAAIDGADDLQAFLDAQGGTAIVKTRRFGYDGKGQVRVGPSDAPDAALDALGHVPAIAEAVVDFEREISVIVARGPGGDLAIYDPVENRHENHILRETIAPAEVPWALAEEARDTGARVASAVGLVGLLAIEMFVTRDGRLLLNEMAPRPHNSGHWTMDACDVDQFEMLVRAVCGLPLGSTARRADARMLNILGEEAEGWREWLDEPGARLHLYGKRAARPGRKMGHVTRLFPLSG